MCITGNNIEKAIANISDIEFQICLTYVTHSHVKTLNGLLAICQLRPAIENQQQ